jgi:hypothetical protein
MDIARPPKRILTQRHFGRMFAQVISVELPVAAWARQTPSGFFDFAGPTPPVNMYYFAIAIQVEMPYPLAPPQGWEAFVVFENLAASTLATDRKAVLGSWYVGERYDPLPTGIGFGIG